MYLQEWEKGSYCIVGLEKSETQEGEEKRKKSQTISIAKKFRVYNLLGGDVSD